MQIFEHLKQIIKKDNLNYYDNLSDGDKKSFSSFMIQRFLSMNKNWIELVNFINKYVFTLKDRHYYKLMCLLIPNQDRTFYKYIKNENKKDYNDKVIDSLIDFYKIPKRQAKEYYDIMDNEQLYNLVSKYGYQEKDLKKIKKSLDL